MGKEKGKFYAKLKVYKGFKCDKNISYMQKLKEKTQHLKQMSNNL